MPLRSGLPRTRERVSGSRAIKNLNATTVSDGVNFSRRNSLAGILSSLWAVNARLSRVGRTDAALLSGVDAIPAYGLCSRNKTAERTFPVAQAAGARKGASHVEAFPWDVPVLEDNPITRDFTRRPKGLNYFDRDLEMGPGTARGNCPGFALSASVCTASPVPIVSPRTYPFTRHRRTSQCNRLIPSSGLRL
jgi:hypothetical protein